MTIKSFSFSGASSYINIVEHGSCVDVQEVQEHEGLGNHFQIQEHVTLRFRNIQVVLMYRKFRNIDIQEHGSYMISGTFWNSFIFSKITFEFTLTFRNTEVVSGIALYSGTLKLHSKHLYSGTISNS